MFKLYKGEQTSLVVNGPVEKMAFFDASGLYALNPQQEALNCIIFIFNDL